MKQIDKHRTLFWAVFVALPLFIIGCLEFESITQPERALIDTEINVVAKLKVVPETDGSGRLVFAILAPVAWNLTENASLTLTTLNYGTLQGGTDVVNETLALIPASDLEPNSKKSWSEAFQTVKGIGNNAQLTTPVDVEWIVWRSSTTFTINDKVNKEAVLADVKIKLSTGEIPVTCYLGYSYCYDGWGLKANEARDAIDFRSITTYGAVLATVPSVLRYGDIFAVQFSPKNTELDNDSEVYLCGTAVYNNGQRAEVTVKESRNLMEKINNKLFEKYIYPKLFFDLPADAVIEELRFYFTNADGTRVVMDDTKGFLVEQAAE
ncbi:MAG: DUF4961 domain-containing protein [Alistipes sp.]